MKQRTQILALGLAGALFAGVVGGIGLVTNRQLQSHIHGAIDASHALQASQAADMMHDAIRGDAQLAMLGTLENNPGRIAEAAQELNKHADTMRTELGKLKALPLSPDSRQAFEQADPAVAAYIDAAQKMVLHAGANRAADGQRGQALQSAFADLETKLAALSDAIEHSGQAQNARTEAAVHDAAWAIGSALLCTVAAMAVFALWLARRMNRPMAAAVEAAGRLAAGDLTGHIAAAGNAETVQLLESLQRMREGFARIVRDVKANADSVAATSAQIAQGNTDLSQRTEQQASSLQQAAASMEQLASTVRQNADNAQQANQLAQGACTVAVKGGDAVGQVIATMNGINDSSKKIADIISVIDGIAFQTNILALNAAVESARAGEHGRGFAVVANEVRSLAQRSSEAAKEIKSLITASVERVAQGTSLVDQAGATMEDVVRSVRRVTDIMGEISAASTQQSVGVAQIGEAVTQMDQSTQRNAAMVEESAAAAELLKGQALDLVQSVSVFKLA